MLILFCVRKKERKKEEKEKDKKKKSKKKRERKRRDKNYLFGKDSKWCFSFDASSYFSP